MNPQFRMICIEGMPFTGKSTTSEYVAGQLGLNGVPARWVSEGTLFQRYFPQTSQILERTEPFAADAVLGEWRGLVDAALAAEPVLVVDSALSYVGVAPFLMEDLPVAEVRAHLRRIAELCAPLRPRVIHLTGDAGWLVPASIAERGEGWREHLIRTAEAPPYQQARGRTGLEAAVSMLGESQVFLSDTLGRDSWPALELAVPPPDWAAHRRAILGFLNLAEVEIERPALTRETLESYAGTYVTDDPERRNREFMVRLESGGLALHTARERYGLLLPVTETRFHLQATPVDIEFAAGGLTVLGDDGAAHPYRRA